MFMSEAEFQRRLPPLPGGGWSYYLIAWVFAAVVLIPWSILDLIRIHRDQWDDMELPLETYESSSH